MPCLFSAYPRKSFSSKRGRNQENLLDELQRTGIDVLWLENNSDCKGACLRVPTRDIPEIKQGHTMCSGNACLDEVMLEDLPDHIVALDGPAVIVLHTMGSHGPAYYKRYLSEMEHFTPVCRTNQLGQCSQEALLNVYDNTIRYTDHFLARLIELLQREAQGFDTVMWYVSDHGESLGEKGVYLHGAPYALAPEAQIHVPMLMWFSPAALSSWSLNQPCLTEQQSRALTHDHVFHSILGLLQVRTGLYQSNLDLFSVCRAPE